MAQAHMLVTWDAETTSAGCKSDRMCTSTSMDRSKMLIAWCEANAGVTMVAESSSESSGPAIFYTDLTEKSDRKQVTYG